MVKVIIFDIGGVVVHTNFNSLYTGFANAANIDPEFIVDYHKNNWADLLLGNVSLNQFFEAFQKEVGGQGRTAEQLKQIWTNEALKVRVVNEELLNWIDTNRSKYKIGTLTNLTYPRLMLDEAMNLYSHFDFSVLSCVEHLKKPDPEIYNLALKRAGVTAAEAVFIDDKEDYVAGAKEAGIKDFLFVNNELLFEELKQLK